MKRAVLAAALAGASLLAIESPRPLVPWASAEDKDAKKEKARRRRLVDIASSFGAKDTAGLMAKVPKDQKVTLGLEGKDTPYSVEQATGVLNTYFESLQTLTVTTTADSKDVKIVDNVGSFPMTIRKKGERKDRTRHLTVTITDDADHPLQKITVDS